MFNGLFNSNIVKSVFTPLLIWSDKKLSQLSAWLGALFLAGFVALTAVYSVTQPSVNWDMIAYLASAEMVEGDKDIKTVHKEVYAKVKNSVSPAEYKELAEGDSYRLRQSTDAEAFGSMLVMYKVKYLYIEAIRVLKPFLGGVKVMNTMSVVAGLVLGVVVIAWLWSAGALVLAPLFVGLFAFTGYAELMRNGGPDIVQAAIFSLGAYIYWRSSSWLSIIIATSLFLISFAIRPELLIVLTGLVLALVLFGGRAVVPAVATIGALLLYPVLTGAAGHPGWWTHFMFSLNTYSETLIGFDPDFNIIYYFTALVRGITYSLIQQSWLVLTLLAVLMRYILWRSDVQVDKTANLLFWGCLIGLGGKFVVFPIPDTRTYFTPLFVLYLSLSPAISTYLTAIFQRERAAA